MCTRVHMCNSLCICVCKRLYAIKDNLCVEMNGMEAQQKKIDKQNNNNKERRIRENVTHHHTIAPPPPPPPHIASAHNSHTCTNLLTWPEVFYFGIYLLGRCFISYRRSMSACTHVSIHPYHVALKVCGHGIRYKYVRPLIACSFAFPVFTWSSLI